jgi:hypothetical protein
MYNYFIKEKKHICIAFLVIVAACKADTIGWKKLDFRAFSLEAPKGWYIIQDQGLDSYGGGLTNGKDTLWFDYGIYDVDLEEGLTHDEKYAKDTVNGLKAEIMIPVTAGKGVISLYIPKVKEDLRFTLYGTNIKATDTILHIFKSLIFKVSDTLNNPPLTQSKFILLPNGDGKRLFRNYCSSCHSVHTKMLGPPLDSTVNTRNSKWLYTFITNRKVIKPDGISNALHSNYDSQCAEFSNLSKNDVELLFEYISNR